MLRFRSLIARFRDDASGIAMVEFAMVLPVLVALWLGLITVVDAEGTSTKVGRVTATIGDIVAQSGEVNDEDLDKIFLAAEAFMGSADAAKLEMYVAGLDIDDKGRVTVAWTHDKNLKTVTAPRKGASYSVPPTLKTGGTESFVIATFGKFSHEPLFGSRFQGTYDYEYENFFAPRLTDRIDKTN